MEYEELIANAKTALSAYSAQSVKLKSLYEKAKSNSNDAYLQEQRRLSERYYADKNAAAAQSMLSERSAQQNNAARGLAFSGESAQTKVDYDLSLANTLGDLAVNNSENLHSLQKEKAENDAALEKAYLEDENGLLKNQADVSAELASVQAQKEASDKQLQNQADSNTAQGKTNKSGTDKTDESGGDEDDYTPQISINDLANRILTRYGYNKRLTTETQQYGVKQYLDELKNEYNLSDEYYNELVLVLKANGYNEPSGYSFNADSMIKRAEASFKDDYSDFYRLLLSIGTTPSIASERAIQFATTKKMTYFYTRAYSLDSFKRICTDAGLSDDVVYDYVVMVNKANAKNPGSFTLGKYTNLNDI